MAFRILIFKKESKKEIELLLNTLLYLNHTDWLQSSGSAW